MIQRLLHRFDAEHSKFFKGAFLLTALTGLGQLSYPLALPIIGHLYTVEAFGVFTIYMAIVNISSPLISLRYEGALYSCETDQLKALHLRLILSVAAFTTVFWTMAFLAVEVFVAEEQASIMRQMALFIPLGMFLGAGWDVATAWAVQANELRRLSYARMSQPLVLTASHLIFGWIGWGAEGLLLGSMLSYITYAAILFAPRSNWKMFGALKRFSRAQVVSLAKEERHFPLYLAPSQLLTLLIANLPQLTIGFLFGQAAAGLYGLAYRLVAAPVQIVCMPLGNALTSHIANRDQLPRMSMVYLTIAIAFAAVSVPVLGIGLLSSWIVPWLLPAKWAGLEAYLLILAFGAATQALAVPFYESYSLLRRQREKLLIDVGRFGAVAAGLFIPALLQISVLPTITILVAASAIGFLYVTYDASRSAKGFIQQRAHGTQNSDRMSNSRSVS